eukprot:10448322-Alexandrium_andersonii.AAC.1
MPGGCRQSPGGRPKSRPRPCWNRTRIATRCRSRIGDQRSPDSRATPRRSGHRPWRSSVGRAGVAGRGPQG